MIVVPSSVEGEVVVDDGLIGGSVGSGFDDDDVVVSSASSCAVVGAVDSVDAVDAVEGGALVVEPGTSVDWGGSVATAVGVGSTDGSA